VVWIEGMRMQDELWRLVYISQASHALSDAELADLLTVSRQRNQRDNITGALAYHEQRFLQVLEGNCHLVEAVFDRICRDTRNCQQITILRSPIPERAFDGWLMGWLPEEAVRRAGFDLRVLYTRVDMLDVLDEIFIAFRTIGRPS
jgi:hypothetical protein